MAKVAGSVDFKYFNKEPLAPKNLFNRCEKKVKELCEANNAEYREWCTLRPYYDTMMKVHDKKKDDLDDYFVKYWANKLVEYFGYLLWNAVYKTRLDPSVGEKKATNAADQAVLQFEKMFK